MAIQEGLILEKKTAGYKLVHHALEIGAIELLPQGRKLKSGRLSPYFFNSGLFTTGTDLKVLADAYAESLRESRIPFDVIFGPAYKGIPLAVTTAMQYSEKYSRNVEYCFNRKEAKQHGEGGILVGATLNEKKVAIIDDVMTTGETKLEAVNTIQNSGGSVAVLVIGFDREERGMGDLSAVQEFWHRTKIPVIAAATLTDLLDVLKDKKGSREIFEKILAYRKEYVLSRGSY